MSKFSIAVIPGDGVGVEVMPEARKILDLVSARYDVEFDYTEFDWGTDYYLQHGRMMPEGGVEELRPFDAILLGAVGHPDVPDHVTLNGLLLPIRRTFDQYVCERPAKLYTGVPSPLANPGDIDMVVVRENTEGEYSQAGGFVYKNLPGEVAVQTSIFTRHGVERIIRHAFELARKRKGRVTSITKSNAQGYSMVLWDRVFADVAQDYRRYRNRVPPRRRRRDELHPPPTDLRCRGRLKPVRRYPERHLGHDHRQHGACAEFQCQPFAGRPLHVRARAWLRP